MGAIGKMFSGPSSPSISMPPPAAHPPTLGSQQVALAGLAARQKAAAAEGMGFDSTEVTGPAGTKAPQNEQKATLLGQ